MTSLEINNALLIRVPQRTPHVSRLDRVFGRAILRNVDRRSGGRKIVRSGVPFSRYAEGLKANVDGFRSEDEGVGEAVAEREDESPSRKKVFSGRGGMLS